MSLNLQDQLSRPEAKKGWQPAYKQQVYSKLVTITPEVALKMLGGEHRAGNRPLSLHRVKKLAQSIKRGEWITNSNTIGFDINGNLTDGQHRLNAVILAKMAIVTMVTYNLPPESFQTTDIGAIRTAGDIAAIIGIKKNHVVVGAAANLLFYYQANAIGHGWAKPTNTQIRDILLNNRDLEKSAEIGMAIYPALMKSIAAFCHYIFSQIDPLKADQFMEYMRTGANMPPDHPCLVLRNHILKQRLEGIQYQQNVMVAMTFKAWNYFRQGRKIKKIHWKQGDAMPKPL